MFFNRWSSSRTAPCWTGCRWTISWCPWVSFWCAASFLWAALANWNWWTNLTRPLWQRFIKKNELLLVVRCEPRTCERFEWKQNGRIRWEGLKSKSQLVLKSSDLPKTAFPLWTFLMPIWMSFTLKSIFKSSKRKYLWELRSTSLALMYTLALTPSVNHIRLYSVWTVYSFPRLTGMFFSYLTVFTPVVTAAGSLDHNKNSRTPIMSSSRNFWNRKSQLEL